MSEDPTSVSESPASVSESLASTSKNLAFSSKSPASTSLSSTVKSDLSILSRSERIFYLLSDDVTKCCCLFLSYIIPYFDRVNENLQAQTPLIHKLRYIFLNFFQEILSKFVKPPEKMSDDNEGDACLKIDYHNPDNLKDDDDILIDHETSTAVNPFKLNIKESIFMTT